MLIEFPKILRPTFSCTTVSRGVQHYVPTACPPVHAKARRLSPEFAEMESMGIIRKSNSAWASPLHIVPKLNGGWRQCGDYRRLNDVTTPDRYPIPHIQDVSAQLAGMNIFSKIDLVRGNHQIPVAPEYIFKTAIVARFGLYEYLRMPFGLKNAAQAFQRLMDTVFQGVSCVCVYLGDILIASSSAKNHVKDVQRMCQRLKTFGLIIIIGKCLFGVDSIQFIRHQVTATGAVPLPIKVKAIEDFPKPQNIRALQELLGMINFYFRFILRPLYCALKDKSQKTTTYLVR